MDEDTAGRGDVATTGSDEDDEDEDVPVVAVAIAVAVVVVVVLVAPPHPARRIGIEIRYHSGGDHRAPMTHAERVRERTHRARANRFASRDGDREP